MRHPLYTLLLLSFAATRLFAASETNAEPAKAAVPAPVKAVAPAPDPVPAAAPVKAAPAATPASVPSPAVDGTAKAVAKGSEDEGSDEEKDSSEPTETEKPADPRFERYKTIMDRMPFGPEPANFDPDGNNSRGAGSAGEMDEAALEAQLSEEAQRILASVRVSALNVTPGGKVAVGFVDSSQQPAVTYYMKVGETRNGWSVKDADMKSMTVTLEKDGVEATMKLGEGSDGSKDGKKGGAMAGRGGMGGGMGGRGRPSFGGGMMPGMGMRGMRGMGGMGGMGGMPSAAAGANGAPPPNETGSDALARLRMRRAQKEAERQAENARISAAAELARQEAAAEREKAAAEREKAAAAREQQMEAIRQIQEEMRRRREAEEQQKAEAQQQQQQQQQQPEPPEA